MYIHTSDFKTGISTCLRDFTSIAMETSDAKLCQDFCSPIHFKKSNQIWWLLPEYQKSYFQLTSAPLHKLFQPSASCYSCMH